MTSKNIFFALGFWVDKNFRYGEELCLVDYILTSTPLLLSPSFVSALPEPARRGSAQTNMVIM